MLPAQEILSRIHREILATTKLPYAIEFLSAEIQHTGRLSDGMNRLVHYFAPYQAFVMSRAEEDRSKFDQRLALEVLAAEAEYRSREPTPAGLFVFQFETLSRNRLGYDKGLLAISLDPIFDEPWREWIQKVRHQVGTIELSDLIYYVSENFVQERRRQLRDKEFTPDYPILFGAKEGRIARANRGRDPLYMFAALQRQLGYPAVPRRRVITGAEKEIPVLTAKVQQLEKRLQLLEQEHKGELDISQFFTKQPPEIVDPPAGPDQE
jgi:hypothetical protein